MEKVIKKVSSFLYENWWHWVIRQWFYNIDRDIFEMALEEYLNTWNNVLNEYDSIIHLLWRAKSSHFWNEITEHDIELFEKAISKESFWNIYSIYSDDELSIIKLSVDLAKQYFEYKETYKSKRKEAQSYIQNKNNRKRIFNKHWAICKFCWSTENLSIDHIIPVSKWWLNEDDNLQILCKSCNSKKSNKI